MRATPDWYRLVYPCYTAVRNEQNDHDGPLNILIVPSPYNPDYRPNTENTYATDCPAQLRIH
jgi:hypothetical protein